jgi:hypothetical protein
VSFPAGYGLRIPRSKIFVSYHHGDGLLRGDQRYYDAFSARFHDGYEVIHDRSLRERVRSNNLDYVLRCVREDNLTGTSCTIVLVGEHTWGRKFVDWEIQATLNKQHALIGVWLPTMPASAGYIPGRLVDNIVSQFASWVGWDQIMQSPAALQACIAQARARPASLIDNTRPAMTLDQSG